MNIFTSNKSVALVTKITITIVIVVIIISIVIAILLRHRVLTGQHLAYTEECSQNPGVVIWTYISVNPKEEILRMHRLRKDSKRSGDFRKYYNDTEYFIYTATYRRRYLYVNMYFGSYRIQDTVSVCFRYDAQNRFIYDNQAANVMHCRMRVDTGDIYNRARLRGFFIYD